MPEQALDGIPLGLGSVVKINLLNFHVHVVKSHDQLTHSASQSVAKMIANKGFSYRPLKKC